MFDREDNSMIQSYGLDLKDSHNTYFLLSKLLNPKNIIECNYLYKFIRDALEIRIIGSYSSPY